MYFFLLLGLCLLIPFRFHMQVDDRRHTSPHHHQHDISVYACGVFMGAIYWFLGFRHSMAGRGDASLQPFLSLTTFLCWAYPMWFFGVFGCSLSWCHPWQSQFITSPFGQRHQRDNPATSPEAGGKNNPASFSFCGSRLVLLDNLVSYREYLMDSLVADIIVHIDTA